MNQQFLEKKMVLFWNKPWKNPLLPTKIGLAMFLGGMGLGSFHSRYIRVAH
jgi:hypothetical protein